jgi:hypothetical protein
VAKRLELPEPGLYLAERVEVMFPGPFCRRFLTGVALGRMERVVRTTRAGQALAVRAGIRRGHHGDRCNSGEGTGRLHQQDPPEDLMLLRQGSGQDGRILRDNGKPVLPADRNLGRPDRCFVAGRKGEDEGDDLPVCFYLIHDRLMFGCNLLGSRFRRIVHHGQLLVVDMVNDLIPEREESIFMSFFIFVNMDRRDLKGIVTVCVNFFVGDSFVVFLDVNHQHMEME